MSLLSLIFTLVLVGFVMWVLNSVVPMDSRIRNILNVAVVIFLVLWLLQQFGLMSALNIRL